MDVEYWTHEGASPMSSRYVNGESMTLKVRRKCMILRRVLRVGREFLVIPIKQM